MLLPCLWSIRGIAAECTVEGHGGIVTGSSSGEVDVLGHRRTGVAELVGDEPG
jgi:hypothetical protein